MGGGENYHTGWESPIHVVSSHKFPFLKDQDEENRLRIKE
ncbi:hypothetical protein AVEN_234939-1, partial [Araneus ventricosus]